ncbi:RNase P/MRP, p29 subunit [Lactarius akahatsu]|uniref:RNase P/MRP, p29 subunit n=1 Tax=Lactarius akahatsu TaxID=416441 RepID=A0AAD4Q795_9AGAM|nr:RNase P/MRP, p29 subunit [Lactarius akahatsu]
MALYQGTILPDPTSDKHHDHGTTTHVRLTSTHPFTPEFVQRQLLLPATSAKSKSKSRVQARALYDERVRRRQLILAPKPPDPNRNRRPRRPKKAGGAADDARMGRREAAEKGLWRLRKKRGAGSQQRWRLSRPNNDCRWELFVPLHRLWLGYMSELLGLAAPPPTTLLQVDPSAMPQAAGMHAKLVKADFHGSIVTVRRSKNPSLVGASGIVIQETENTFKVVTQKDRLKVLPKQGSVFVFAVPLYHTGTKDPTASIVAAARSSNQHSGTDCTSRSRDERLTTVLDGAHVEFELYGNQFCFRATERAGRKFKHKESIEL